MKIEVDVTRAEQSWDLDTGLQQNYLVVDVLGVEVRVPCSGEELGGVIARLKGGDFDPPALALDEAQKRPEPQTFIASATSETPEVELRPPAPGPDNLVPPRRRPAPLVRPERGDDAGIAQG